MSGKAGRKQRGQQQRLQRKLAAEQRRRDALARAQAAATAAGTELPPSLPALDPRPNPADAPPAAPAHRRVGKGERAPGQQIACGWCGQLITIGARGPLPKWCSASCRHRAWEQQRAAQAGLSAVQVHDRYVIAIPNDADGWIDHLYALSAQVSFTDKGGPIPYPDLDRVAAAIQHAHAALEARRHRLPPYRPD